MTDRMTIDNISGFFEIGKYHYRVFDMSRRVQQLSNQRFRRIEMQQELYPSPFQQHASLGILFWKPNNPAEAIIWFLRFPVDALGFLKLETRDAFIQQLLEQVGEKIKQEKGLDDSPQNISESPFAFKPSQDKMAMFNAFATKALGQPASGFYEHTREYMLGNVGYEQWSFVGLQGIADMLARVGHEDNEKILLSAIPALPDTPLVLLTQLMENIPVSGKLSRILLERLQSELQKPDRETLNIAVVAGIIRALALSKKPLLRDTAIKSALETDNAQGIEIIAAISSRCWEALESPQLLHHFLESLAGYEQEQFDAVLMDLLPIPGMRECVMGGLRTPERTADLAARIGGFMSRFRQ